MNNTTLGHTVLPLSCEAASITLTSIVYNIGCLILRLPVNIFMVQLIISRDLVMSEFCALNEAVLEIDICFYDLLGVALYALPDLPKAMWTIRCSFIGFIVMGRPCLMALICVERYLAVLKPVLYLSLKPLKYHLALSGTFWLLTLASCVGRVFLTEPFHYISLVVITLCSAAQLYCCVAILLALKQPPPGEGAREGMSNTKRKAFTIILITTISVSLTYGPLTVVLFLRDHLPIRMFVNLFTVFYASTAVAGLVQAGLFLHRSGKLPFFKWP